MNSKQRRARVRAALPGALPSLGARYSGKSAYTIFDEAATLK